MNTRDQNYAARIFEQVLAIKDDANIDVKKYGSMAHKLPILIRTAGLAQALAFADARGNETSQRILLDHLAEVISNATAQQLLERSRTASLGEYMCLTQQVMAALLWYKRFAQSVLGVGQDEQGDGR